jgi:hypothetical protein
MESVAPAAEEEAMDEIVEKPSSDYHVKMGVT